MPSTNKLVIKKGLISLGDSEISGSLNVITGITGSLFGTASFATTAATLGGNVAGAFATTGSNTFTGNQNVTGNVNITGTLTANTYIVSSSLTNMTVAFASGSTAFGNSSDDTHNFTGSLSILGSLTASGGITGSLFGTASKATNADNALITTQDTTSNTYNVVFTGGTSGYNGLNIDTTTLTYNPSTGIFGKNKISASSIDTVTGGITGSFKGDGSGITGVTATAVFPASQTTPILSTTKLFSNDGSNTFVYVGQVTGSTYAGVSGDVTIGTGGVAAIGSGKVTSAMIVDGTITGTDIAAGTVANSNLVNSGSVLGSTPLVLGTTVTTVAGLASITSDTFVVNGATGSLDINGRSRTFAITKGLAANTSATALDVDVAVYPITSIHIKYTLYDSSYANLRAGSIIIASNAVNGGSDIVIAETSTQDIGDTSTIDFTAAIGGGGTHIRLIADTTLFNDTSTLNLQYTLI